MLRLLALISTLPALIHGRTFNNPVLRDADYPDPGAIKVDGTYYVVTTTNNNLSEKYPIHFSTDLNNWTKAGYVFDANNLPPWTDKDHEFWAPEIHKIGNNFHVYFSARDFASGRLSIGVAIASHPSGPYKSADRPVWLDPDRDVFDATIMNDNGNLYLLWKSGNSIKGRPLSTDGLSFSSDQITELLFNDLPWEDTLVEAPWYVRKGDYHYIMYSGHDMCSELYRVGVARSRNPLGPYEKRGDPILASNKDFEGPGHNSMVKDLDDQGDVMVFHTFRRGEVCGPWPRLTALASVGWGDDGWPYVYDF